MVFLTLPSLVSLPLLRIHADISVLTNSETLLLSLNVDEDIMVFTNVNVCLFLIIIKYVLLVNILH